MLRPCENRFCAVLLTAVLFLSCQVSRLAAEPAFVGMQVQGVSQKVAAAFGIDKLEGVLGRNAALNGPANMAGIHRGDMIVK